MMRYFRLIFASPRKSQTNSDTDEDTENHIQLQEAARRFNYSRYATKKTVAQGLLDVALLMSNASQLKAIMDVGTSHSYYHAVFGIVIFSIILQIVIAIMLLVLGTSKDETEEQKKKMNYLNNVIIVLILLITVCNVFLTAFGVQFEGAKKIV